MITLFFHILKQSYVNKQIKKKNKLLIIINIKRKLHFLYYIGRRYISLMQIIVVSFPYHVCLKKAIAHVVSKIKSADRTNALVLD